MVVHTGPRASYYAAEQRSLRLRPSARTAAAPSMRCAALLARLRRRVCAGGAPYLADSPRCAALRDQRFPSAAESPPRPDWLGPRRPANKSQQRSTPPVLSNSQEPLTGSADSKEPPCTSSVGVLVGAGRGLRRCQMSPVSDESGVSEMVGAGRRRRWEAPLDSPPPPPATPCGLCDGLGRRVSGGGFPSYPDAWGARASSCFVAAVTRLRCRARRGAPRGGGG
eukprot:COSAG01_NODE_6361_length_3713_cov_2.193691_1_plen_223_part_10